MKIRIGRVYATTPDEAALKVRDKHPTYKGRLTLHEAMTFDKTLKWYEYSIRWGCP